MVSPALAIMATTAGRNEVRVSQQKGEVLISGIDVGKQGDKDTGRQNVSGGCDDGSGGVCNLCSHKSCGVDCNWTGGHLGNSEKVCEGVYRKPLIQCYELFLNKRHVCISSAEAKTSDL